jgi:type VI secretion system secreted protein VgrG
MPTAKILDANTPWFTFSMDNFSVYSFTGLEEVCKPYEFEIELISHSDCVNIDILLGMSAHLSILDRSGGSRIVHGIIAEFEQLHTANEYTHYLCKLVPRLWFLDKNQEHRIFQNISVPDIIKTILEEHFFVYGSFNFYLFYKYEPREYCVQYGESDLYFLQRLCEEEGIFFYFDHTSSSHSLCFCDREGGSSISGESEIRFFPGSGQHQETSVISRLKNRRVITSNSASYRERNFLKPKLDLEVKLDDTEAPRYPGMLLEKYQYPHIYNTQSEGSRYAHLQLQRQQVFKNKIEIISDVSRFLPGKTFLLKEHNRDDLNRKWWVFSVYHEGQQPSVLEHESPDNRGMRYTSNALAIPETTRFIPQIEHPKKIIHGQQTAIVTGPEGEEIYPDKQGRVKVQFFWDRSDQWNENASCWIRVSQGWAGNRYGGMAIPRIGHEVIVSFLEGNPDRPLITGRVYHALNIPPYELPKHKTVTVLKSFSSPGENDKPRGFNELRIEDKAGNEELYVHAQKDINTYIKNDWKDIIIHDRHLTVKNEFFTQVDGEIHEFYGNQRKTEILADENLTVHANSHTKIGEKWLVKAGTKAVLEAGTEFCIKAGGTILKINAGGIFVDGSLFMCVPVKVPDSAKPQLPAAVAGVREEPLEPKISVCRTLQLNNAAVTGAPAVSNPKAANLCKAGEEE